jgi:CRP-like cAMP-binding protein
VRPLAKGPAIELEQAEFFRTLSPERLARLRPRLRERSFAPQQMLYVEGAACDRLWIVRRGSVRLYKSSSKGQVLTLDLLTDRERIYDSADALERYYTGESLSVSRERARLDRARAEAQEMKNARERGDLVEGASLDRALIQLATLTSARVQAVPPAIAQQLAVESTPSGCERICAAAIRGALEDLASEGDAAVARLERKGKRKRRAA